MKGLKALWILPLIITAFVLGCPVDGEEYTLKEVELTVGPSGSAVDVDASGTTAQAVFTGASGLTLSSEDFTVTGGGTITAVAVSGDTVTITVSFEENTGAEEKTYIVGISPESQLIKGDATVTITQGYAGDTRNTLTAGPAATVAASDTTAAVTFTGATGLATVSQTDPTVEAGDFTVSQGAVVSSIAVVEDTVTVTISFEANTDTTEKTYTVGISPDSTVIKGSGTVTITQSGMVVLHAFYVSFSTGNDENAGTEAAPWKTIAKVNSRTFQPGDAILFKSGDTWSWQSDQEPTLTPQGSGAAGTPILLSSYGTGDKPRFQGNGLVNDVIHLHNQQYWEISNLDISNLVEGFTNPMARTDAQGTLIDNKDLRGIRISGNNGETLSNFHLHDLNIHDVTGQIWWIGGSASSSGPGFRLATGWDASKRTGAILVEGLDGDNPTIFTNVTVENNVFERNSFGAFTTKQFLGTKIWATPSVTSYPYNDPNFKPHTNITVRGNYIDQSGWYHGDGIYLTSVRGALVENNVVKDPGVCGIEMYWSDSITVQYNEVYGSTSKGGGGDTNGIDPDIRTSNIIVQYNYIHDNGDGILVCGNNYNTVIIRYNVLYNNKTRWIRDVVSGGFIQVYNNVMYNTTSQSTAGTITFTGQSTTGNDIWEYRNNVFYNAHAGTTNGSFVAGTTYSYSDNLYYGITAPASHANATVGDPVFTGIPEFLTGTSVATRFHDFSLLKPTTGSPLINRGVAYSAPENPKRIDAVPNGLDYAGVAVGTTDIGLYAANFNGLSGIVTSMLDNSIVAGATVTLTPSGGGTGQTSTTNESGKYSFAVVNPGSYVIKVAVTNFLDSETPFEANVDSVSWLPLKTGGFVGLSGFVKNEFEEIISGATVTLTPSGGGNPMTATSDASGMYSFVTVNSGTYTIKVSATGYEDSEITRAIDSATSPLTLYTGAFSAIYKRTVTGTITTTSSGGPLSGATVAISKNGVSMGSATTNANGEYTLANIPIGAGYTISAEKSGYNTKTRLKLVVTDDPQTVVDFILRDDQSIEENFEKTSLTSMKWTLRSGNGIQGSNTGGMSQTLVEDPVDSTNSAGEYLGNGNGPRGTQLNLTRPIIGDTVYVEFDWYIGRPLGSYGQLSIQDGTTANFPSTASNAVFDNKFITFAASSNNSFYYRLGNFTDSVNPTTNGGVALTGFTAAVLNSWVNVKVSIDFQASTISFEIRKKSDNSVLASETALPFATGITYNSKVESLRFLARQPGTNGWRTYLDNLYIGLIP